MNEPIGRFELSYPQVIHRLSTDEIQHEGNSASTSTMNLTDRQILAGHLQSWQKGMILSKVKFKIGVASRQI